MKRKWKWLLLFTVPFLAFAAGIWIVTTSSVPIEVIDDKIPDSEVPTIMAGVTREWRKRILPKLSWDALKKMPAKMKERANMKLYSILPGESLFQDYQIWPGGKWSPRAEYGSMTSGPPFVVVLAWRDTNTVGTLWAGSNSSILRRTLNYFELGRLNRCINSNALMFILRASSNGWERPDENMRFSPNRLY